MTRLAGLPVNLALQTKKCFTFLFMTDGRSDNHCLLVRSKTGEKWFEKSSPHRYVRIDDQDMACALFQGISNPDVISLGKAEIPSVSDDLNFRQYFSKIIYR